MKIYAEIVTYNPDIKILEENIASVKPQVDKVIIYDNGSANYNDFKEMLKSYDCDVIKCDKNNGIAEALAVGIDKAYEEGADYVYALDHDTVSNKDVISKLLQSMKDDPEIAMIGCGKEIGLYDEFKDDYCGGCEYVRQIVTAGSLLDVNRAIEVGNYNRDMFIDWVDVEMCYRLITAGYKVAVHRGAVMKHLVGEPTQKKVLSRNYTLYNYSPFRLYHIFRNTVYLFYKYPNIVKTFKEKTWVYYKWPLQIILFEKNKFQKARAIIKGFVNGYRMARKDKVITFEQAFKKNK